MYNALFTNNHGLMRYLTHTIFMASLRNKLQNAEQKCTTLENKYVGTNTNLRSIPQIPQQYWKGGIFSV